VPTALVARGARVIRVWLQCACLGGFPKPAVEENRGSRGASSRAAPLAGALLGHIFAELYPGAARLSLYTIWLMPC